MSNIKLTNPNLSENLEESYFDFFKNIVNLLNTYIELNRSLIMYSDSQKIEMIHQDIKNLMDENVYLKKYLSHCTFKRKINKMIMSNENSAYCSRKIILEELGDGIKRMRKSNNITMKQLSATTNVSVSFISKIENYHIARPPQYMFIHKIISLYSCDIEYIFGIIDSPKCRGELLRKPITMVGDSDYPIFFSVFPQYTDITEMLKTIYCSNNVKAIDSVRSFLSELTENMKDN